MIKRKYERLDKGARQKIIALALEGYNGVEIGSILGIPAYRVRLAIRKHNLQPTIRAIKIKRKLAREEQYTTKEGARCIAELEDWIYPMRFW